MDIHELTGQIKKHAVFLKNWMEQNPERTSQLLGEITPVPPTAPEELQRLNIKNFVTLPEKDIIHQLRRYKTEEYVKICARELSSGETLESVAGHITTVAKTALEIALNWSLNFISRKYSVEESFSTLAILGLGKLGGNELNFSSDIDILFVYQEDGAALVTGIPRNLTRHEFYCEVTKKTVELISTHTPEGIVFRVDQRLRPDGERGPVAMSVDAYAFYYEAYGQTWERMMLIKATHSAGCEATAEAFQLAVRPFIYRRNLDQLFIEEVIEILGKARGRAKLRYRGAKNVKLGEGSLREIEFFVQIMQILNYPRYEITHPGTLMAMASLFDAGVITAEDFTLMNAAYRFYRNLEHKAQMENETQTYTVPEASPTYSFYLERCGYDNDDEFQRDYTYYSTGVSHIFEKLTGQDTLALSLGELLFDNVFDTAEVEFTLEKLQVKEPEKCSKILYHSMYSQSMRSRNATEITMLKKIFGQVLEISLKSADLARILSFYQRLLYKSSTLYMLYEIYTKDASTLSQITNIFETSPYLTEIILGNNNVLYHLFGTVFPEVTQGILKEEILGQLPPGQEDPEQEYAKIRMLHKDYLFRIGYAFINKTTDILRTMPALTETARAVTEIAFSRSWTALCQRYGVPTDRHGNPAEYIVIAMGKLGSGEMSFASDLDLIVLYSAEGETSGAKSITNGEFYHRLVQRSTAYLSTITSQGYLYHIDMNLRPSGASGALVTTLEAFEEYQNHQAMIWEKQAILKAAALCGNPEMRDKFEQIRKRVILEAAQDNALEKSVYTMRRRLDKEKGGDLYNMKHAPGGFTDIEFAVQMLSLRHGITERNTLAALKSLKEQELITKRNFDVFEKGYLFYRETENILRLHENRSTTVLPASGFLLHNISRVMGYKNSGLFLEDYNLHRRSVRGAFERVFNKG